MRRFYALFAAIILCGSLTALSALAQQSSPKSGKFEPIDPSLPTPNTYRTASGAPGHQYWQQKADYVINVELNDENQSLSGSETITYHNNSPDALEYLWLQLDQNHFAKEADAYGTRTGTVGTGLSVNALKRIAEQERFEGGYKIKSVKDAAGKTMKYTVNKTMMRVDLPAPLRSGQKLSFSIEWSFNIVPRHFYARSCYEFFPKDSNYSYAMAQFFPRMAVYGDATGWQHKQFLGTGEFTLPFGDYKVSVTAPADHVIGATGTLQNSASVLNAEQRARLKKAETSAAPVEIITPKEAEANEKSRSKQKKTWVFTAEKVRDFAFVSSRKFIWDAMGAELEGGKRPMAMSFFPKEGNPLWGQYSTRAVAHTLKVYSKHTFPYPYPVAISVNAPVGGGMEYPMICFNGPRPDADGTYSADTKYNLLTIIFHEVGHNFFPMIVNSDERQWSWMDEGLNSFMQFLAEQEWDRNFPSSAGFARTITDYMKTDKSLLTPIMTTSDNIPPNEFGPNAYDKPATALNILRETVMGRELFDFAFKTYARRWMFKHPTPSDFFRTLEDASGVDLDWFWRGWFYGVENCDVSLEAVKRYVIDTQNPDVEQALKKNDRVAAPGDISSLRNKQYVPKTLVEADTAAQDYYNKLNPFAITPWDKEAYEKYMAGLSDDEKKALSAGYNFYELRLKNIGGLVMPVILEITYEDGGKEIRRFPAEIWRYNQNDISKIVITKKPVKSFVVDPYLETADTDLSNNAYPRRQAPSRFQLFKNRNITQPNPMQIERRYQENEKKNNTGTH